MTREEKVAWAGALRPGHLVDYHDQHRHVKTTTPIWGLTPRGASVYTVCMGAIALIDAIFDTEFEPRICDRAHYALIRAGSRRIVDVEVVLDNGSTCSAVHELLPVL